MSKLYIKEQTNKYILIFVMGGFLGWLIELIYRSAISHQVVNPGFLSGPFLPIYGFGLVLLTLILNQKKWNWLEKIFIFAILATSMELIAGIFFQYIFHFRLWNYSSEWGNWHGWVCPRFFLYWMLSALIYYIFFSENVNQKIESYSHSKIKLIIGYIIILLIFFDLTHSFYNAEQIGDLKFLSNKKIPVLSEYKIFQPDRATNFFNSVGQSIKNYSNYNLIKKIIKK